MQLAAGGLQGVEHGASVRAESARVGPVIGRDEHIADGLGDGAARGTLNVPDHAASPRRRRPAEPWRGGGAQGLTPWGSNTRETFLFVLSLHTVKGCAGHEKPILTRFALIFRRQYLYLPVGLQVPDGL